MKSYLLVLVCLVTTCIVQAQSVKKESVNETLEEVVHDIIQLAAEGNAAEIDKKYIHPEFGIYDVFRIGVPDAFEQHDSIAFAFPERPNHSMYPNLKEITSEHTRLEIELYNAVYDCNEMVWDCEGLFITDVIDYPKISKIIKQPVFETSEFPESFHNQIKHIEENSHRVVLTETDLVFYITKIDDAWYLTLLDRVTTDCSA